MRQVYFHIRKRTGEKDTHVIRNIASQRDVFQSWHVAVLRDYQQFPRKTTNKKLAQKLAEDYEAVARNHITEAQVCRVLGDLHRMTTGVVLGSITVRGYLNQWLKAKNGTVSDSTKLAYESAVREFCEFLGERADLELLYLTTGDIAGFRDHVASTRVPATANNRLKILRVAFQQAWRDGIIDDNPAAKVPMMKASRCDTERRAFTLPELKKLLGAATGEWRGLILFGVYTGQRLGDIVRLHWSNVDLQTDTVALTTQKTQRRQILPIAKPLRRWLDEQKDLNEVGNTVIFPSLFAQIVKTGRVGPLSNQFYELLTEAGLVSSRSHKKNADRDGRNGRRTQSNLSFHSLRHTATSLMKNAGVSPAIVQKFVGHDSKAVSQHYTHIELAALRKATEALPEITD